MNRIGFGYDIHRLEEGNGFYLGGIWIPHSKSVIAHSDGDVLIHALIDALLGAANLNDIGTHFPDNDPVYHNMDSKNLLKHTIKLLQQNNYTIGNIDTTICLEKPKLKEHIPGMKQILANCMNIAEGQVSIKATTNEKMGPIGNQEAIVAYAVALIQNSS